MLANTGFSTTPSPSPPESSTFPAWISSLLMSLILVVSIDLIVVVRNVNLSLLLNCLKYWLLNECFREEGRWRWAKAYNVFALGEGTSDLESREKVWFGQRAVQHNSLICLVQSVKHLEAVELLLGVWVVWFDLAARLAVILQEKETRGDSPVSPKTHHLLHFVDFVSCAIRQNCPPPPTPKTAF